jgi:hypothetical protein
MFNLDNFTEFNQDVNRGSDFVPQTGQDLHEQLIRKSEIAYATDSIKINDFLADYPDSHDDDEGKYNELEEWAKNYQEREGKDGRMRTASPPQSPFCSPPITNRGVSKYRSYPKNPQFPNPTQAHQSTTSTNSIYFDKQESGDNTEVVRELQEGGYDGGVEVGFEGYWNKELFAGLIEKLEHAKNQASEISDDFCTEIGGYEVLVGHSGANAGLHYKYRFTIDGVVFLIHHNPPKGRQCVRIRYGATALIGRSLFTLHLAVLAFLRSLGFIVTCEKLSRVDMQVLVKRQVSDFVLPILRGHAVKKSRIDSIKNRCEKIETYTLGNSGRLELCIYDKRAELHHALSQDPIKYQLMLRHCIDPEYFFNDGSITRIEFRLWRDALRAVGIDTVQDLQEREYALADWLTTHWFRLLEKPKIRGHENLASIHPFWLEVQSLFRKWFPGVGNDNKPVEWSPREPVSCDPVMLEKQAAGCLASALALRYGAQATKKQTLDLLKPTVESLGDYIFSHSCERVQRLEIQKGVQLGEHQECNTDVERECWKKWISGLETQGIN